MSTLTSIMVEIKIKEESLPERCEICHQVDYFDAKLNYCSRCAKSNVVMGTNNPTAHEGKITLNVSITAKEFSNARRWLIFRNKMFLILTAIFVCAILQSLYHSLSDPNSNIESLFLAYLPFTLFILLWTALIFLNGRLTFNKIKDLYTNQRYTFSHKGVELSTNQSFTQTDWGMFSKIAETNESFIMVQTGSLMKIIPKRCFSNPDEITIFRSTVKEKLGNKAKLTH